jgi:peptidoglycan/LPS O-acetylase OafA/YrhL
MKLLCGLAMSFIAFGGGDGLSKRTGALFALVLLFGGGVWAAYYALGGQGSPETPDLKLVLPAVGLCYAAVALWCRKTPAPRRRMVRMTVEFRGCAGRSDAAGLRQ